MPAYEGFLQAPWCGLWGPHESFSTNAYSRKQWLLTSSSAPRTYNTCSSAYCARCRTEAYGMAELQSLLGCKCCVLTQSAGLRERTTRAWSTCRNWKGFRFQFRWNRMIHLRNHNQLRASGETVIDLYFTSESTKVNGNKNNSIKIDKENEVSRDPLVQRNWNCFHYKTKRNFDKWITLLIWKNNNDRLTAFDPGQPG